MGEGLDYPSTRMWRIYLRREIKSEDRETNRRRNFCDTEVEREKKNLFRQNKLFSLVNATFSRKWDLKTGGFRNKEGLSEDESRWILGELNMTRLVHYLRFFFDSWFLWSGVFLAVSVNRAVTAILDSSPPNGNI